MLFILLMSSNGSESLSPGLELTDVASLILQLALSLLPESWDFRQAPTPTQHLFGSYGSELSSL